MRGNKKKKTKRRANVSNTKRPVALKRAEKLMGIGIFRQPQEPAPEWCGGQGPDAVFERGLSAEGRD